MPHTIDRQTTRNRLIGVPIRPILAPVWLGCERPGVERGPAAIGERFTSPRRRASIDIGDNAPSGALARLHRGDLGFLPEIQASSEAIAAATTAAIADGELALILGGDHSVAFGSLAGAAAACGRLGVLWFDAHLDLNTPETSPTGHLHGMPLAASLGFGPASLTGIGGSSPKLQPADLAMLGVRDIDAGERLLVEREGIWTRSMAEWRAAGLVAALDLALERLDDERIDAVHVSFDLDALDPGVLPGVGTPVPGGLSLAEARLVIDRLRAWNGPIRSIDLVELNPLLDPSGDGARTAVSLLAEFLG